MSSVKNGDWVGTLTKRINREKAAGVTHLLLVQREKKDILYAAAIPIDSVILWVANSHLSGDRDSK